MTFGERGDVPLYLALSVKCFASSLSGEIAILFPDIRTRLGQRLNDVSGVSNA